jgi:hypothetical protein
MNKQKDKRGRQMLGCRVDGIEYSFVYHAGRLYMARGDCCDMADCINYFCRIDPEVERIRTFSGIEEDTSYRRFADGMWEATSPDGSKFGACEISRDTPTTEERFKLVDAE